MLSPGVRGGLLVALGLIAGIVMLSHVHPAHRVEASTASHPTTTVQHLAPTDDPAADVPGASAAFGARYSC